MSDFSLRVVRSDDLLVLTFEFFNLVIDPNDALHDGSFADLRDGKPESSSTSRRSTSSKKPSRRMSDCRPKSRQSAPGSAAQHA
jgi:hypothetical protein